ncbi:MAG: hypothetical protein AB7O45_06730 [Alphaproteobacteria bacterium]
MIERSEPALIDRLDPAEWAIVWGARSWVADRQGSPSSCRAFSWTETFELNGVKDAALSLTALCVLLDHAARRPIDVGCPECGRVSEDEAVLLAAVAQAQAGRIAAARAALATLLPPAGVRFGIGMVSGLAAAFARVGWRLDRADRAGGIATGESDGVCPSIARVQ